MKAAIVPSIKAQWIIKDVPKPKIGANQVLVKIHASGICYTDVYQTNGYLPGNFPRILGHEPAGEIIEIGAGVTNRKIGDRVGVPWLQASCGRCEWCLRNRSIYCVNPIATSMEMPGGHAEFMLAYADATMLIPDNVSYEQAAPIFCAGYTVWTGLRWANPKPNERVAVLGIGGLGHLAIQYAKAAGFETIAISHSSDKNKLIKELGADTIFRDGKELAKNGGANVILSTTNSNQAMTEALGALLPEGRFVAMGLSDKPLQLPLESMIINQTKILGSGHNGPEYLYEALEMVAKAKVKVYCETYPFKEIQHAYERVVNGKVRFRAVILFD